MEYIELTAEHSRVWMSTPDVVEFAQKDNVLKIVYRGVAEPVSHEFVSEEDALKVYDSIREKKIGERVDNIDKPLKDFSGLSVRARRACERAGLKTLGDLAKFPPAEILNIRNAGKGTMCELLEFLHNNGHKSDYE